MTFNLNLSELNVIVKTIALTSVTFTVNIVPTNPAFNGVRIKYKKVTDINWLFVDLNAPIVAPADIVIPGLSQETRYEFYIVAFDTGGDLSDVDGFITLTTLSNAVPGLLPVEERILLDMVATLAAVTPNSVFYNKFNQVDRDRSSSFEIVNHPAAILSGITTQSNNASPQLITKKLHVIIDLHFEVSDNFEAEAQLLKSDVENALLIDTQRTQLATDTRLMETESFHNDESSPPKGLVIMLFEVHFRHKHGDTTKAVC